MNQEIKCAECGKDIPIFEKYYKNDKDGTVLCVPCFEKLLKEGKIK